MLFSFHVACFSSVADWHICWEGVHQFPQDGQHPAAEYANRPGLTQAALEQKETAAEYIHLRPQVTTLPSFGSVSESSPRAASGVVDTAQAAPCRRIKASKSVSIFARAPVCPDTCGTAGANSVMSRLLMMLTLASIASSGFCIRNEYQHGSFRSCPVVIPGVRRAPLNGVDFAMLMDFIYVCGVREWQSCPLSLLGAGTLGRKKNRRKEARNSLTADDSWIGRCGCFSFCVWLFGLLFLFVSCVVFFGLFPLPGYQRSLTSYKSHEAEMVIVK